MGKCVYTYKGKEYTSKESLAQAIALEGVDMEGTQVSYSLTGDRVGLEYQQMVLESEAENNYGTKEFISFNYPNDYTLEVTIDAKALKDLESGEKLLTNAQTGKKESVNIAALIEKEKQGEAIPQYENWLQHKVAFYADKIIENFNNNPTPNVEKQETLQQKLFSFAEKLGISITTLENYLQDRALRENANLQDVEALADIFEKVIAVADKENIDQIAEEVAHFAVEYSMHNPMMGRMLDKVNETEIYQREAPAYRAKYAAEGLEGAQLENKVRKEVMGKILAEKIKDNFNTETAVTSAEVGIFTQLKNLWEAFLDLFRNADEKFYRQFGRVLDEISTNVLDGRAEEFQAVDSKEVFYQMSVPSKVFHQRMEQQNQLLKEAYKSIHEDSRLNKQQRQSLLKEAADALTINKYGQVLNATATVLIKDVENAFSLINKAREKVQTLGGTLNDYIGQIDINNIAQFQSFGATEIEKTIKAIEQTSALKDASGKPIAVFTPAEKASLVSRLKAAQAQLASINGDLSIMVDNAGRQTVEEMLDREGVTDQEVRDKFLGNYDSGVFKDIDSFIQNILSLRTVDNSIVKTIYSLLSKANATVEIGANEFAKEMRELSQRLNISKAQQDKLFDEHHMINGWHLGKVQKFVTDKRNAIIEKYDKKIEKAKTTSEKEALQQEKEDELFDFSREYEESYFKPSFYENLRKLSKNSRDFISARASDRRNILEKYKGNYKIVSNRDLIALEEINRYTEKAKSLYESDGSRKTGIALQLAEDLNTYFNSSSMSQKEQDIIDKYDNLIKNAKSVTEAENLRFRKVQELQSIQLTKDEAEFNRQMQESITNSGGENTAAHQNWLRLNAILTYDDSVYEMLDGGGVEVDAEAMNIPATHPEKPVTVQRIAEKLGLSLTPAEMNNSGVYQDLYNGLINKRKQLTNPYKRIGKPGEIDGNAIQQDPVLVQTLAEIDMYLRAFKIKKPSESQVVFKTEANDAYLTKKAELEKSNPTAWADFKYNVAKVKYVDGQEVPTAFAFRRTRILDSNGQEFKKTYKPNFRFVQKTEQEDLKNPNYNADLIGKTIQYKLNHPELQQFKNKEFFNLFGIDETTDFYGLRGATRNKDLFEMRQFFLDNKEKDDKMIGKSNQYYQLPAVLARRKEAFEGVSGGRRGVAGAIKGATSREFLVENEYDDEINVDAKRVTVPRRYHVAIDDPSKLTRDLSFMFGTNRMAALNYKHKNEILPKVGVLRQKMVNSTTDRGVNMLHSKMYKMLDRYLSIHLYGNLVDETETFTKFLQAVGFNKKISGAKTIKSFFDYVRNTNLGAHFVTPVVGVVSTMSYTFMEGISNNEINTKSWMFAEKETAKNFAQHFTDSGSIKPTSKIKKLMEFTRVAVDNEQMMDGIFENVLYRNLNQPSYAFYKTGSVLSASRAIFAAFDAYRLINGEFININTHRENARRAKKTEQQIQEEWDGAATYYSFLKEGKNSFSVDGAQLKAAGYNKFANRIAAAKTQQEKDKIYNESVSALQQDMNKRVQDYWTKIESQASILDQPLIKSNPWGMFAMMHNQWMANFLQNRFVSKHYDLPTQRYVEGSYLTFAKLMREIVTNPNLSPMEKLQDFGNMIASTATFGMYQKGMEGLEEYQQTNLKRISADFAAYGILFSLWILANLAADDDEDDSWMKQYLAFISSRALVEQGSQMAPFAMGQLIEKVKSPVPATRYMDAIWNMPLYFTEEGKKEITRGAYEGWTKRQKAVMELMWIKNLYRGMNGFEDSNLYFRKQVIPTNEMILKKIKGDE
jgi:hypothetical protein